MNLLILVEGGTFVCKATESGLAPAQDVLQTLSERVQEVWRMLHENGIDVSQTYKAVYADASGRPLFVDSSQAELREHIKVAKALLDYKGFDGAMVIRGTDSAENLAGFLSLLGVSLPTAIFTSNVSCYSENKMPLAKLYDVAVFLNYMAQKMSRQVGVIDWDKQNCNVRTGQTVRKLKTGGEEIYV